MNEIIDWIETAVEGFISLFSWGGKGRHRIKDVTGEDERAKTPRNYVARHLVKASETPYSTPGRATDRGNWGDEPTAAWQIIPPREQWGW